MPPTIRIFALLVFGISALAFVETGEQRATATRYFVNPILDSGADPWVIRDDEWYYFTHTTGRDLRLYRTGKMGDLRDVEVKTVWVPPDTGMNAKHIWAPEIHKIDGNWYFYYAADDGLNENHRMWVLENSSTDPFTGTWVEKGKLQLPDDRWAIDATVFQLNDAWYVLWSGWEGERNVSQNLYIARLKNPWTAEGERILISAPEFTWEKAGGTPVVNEAPQFLKRGSKMFVIYSASGCWTDDYTLGMLSAPIHADPLDHRSWKKHPEPVFSTNAGAMAYGPGHNSFLVSADESWIVYHANPGPGMGCGGKRSPRMQKFTWTDDGLPDFGEPVRLGVRMPAPSGE